MIRTQIYLPEETYTELKLAANSRKTNFSSLIRQAVEQLLATREKKKKDWSHFIGACPPGGPRDLSSKIDYYLYGEGSKWAKRK